MPESVHPDQVVAQLERIVTSAPLESSPSLCRLLRYVVEETLAGRASSLKEYSLGVVVFERGEDFDPRLDPIVRVQARNLRVRLAQYYSSTGAADPVIIELPKRTYVPMFYARTVETEAPAVVETPAPAAEAPVTSALSKKAIVIAAGLILLGASGALWKFRSPRGNAGAIHEPDPVAQDLYIRGRYVMDRLSENAIRDSIDSFQRAIARDPQFAAAYAALANSYNVLAQYGYIPPGEGMEQARRAAQKALNIDPGLAEAHVALAAVIEAYDWDWAAAENEYRRALKLNPWLPSAHLWYGSFLRDQGRLQEALPELRRAAQLEPYSVLTSINLADAYKMAGNADAAVEEALHATELNPQLVIGYLLLASAYRLEHKTAEAEAALDRARRFMDDNPHAVALVACAYAWSGKRNTGSELLKQLEEIAKRRYVSPFDMGTISLGLGDEDRALRLLEEAYRQRSSGMIYLRSTHFDSLRRSVKFHSLLEKMHFAG